MNSTRSRRSSHFRAASQASDWLPHNALKLKGRLYSAFVHSVLLYNCEVWNITETEMKALVGRNGYLMRRLVGEVVRSADDKRLTESQLLEMLVDSIQSLIRKRKLQWVAHCARRGDKDLTWKRMVREIEDEESKWGSRLQEGEIQRLESFENIRPHCAGVIVVAGTSENAALNPL